MLFEQGARDTQEQGEIRQAVRRLCADFPGEYWRTLDRDKSIPAAFVAALTSAGFLAALILQEFGGSGSTLADAAVIMEEIQALDSLAGSACHAQMYVMNTLLRHGSAAQKEALLPQIARCRCGSRRFGVTEPGSGSGTLALRTTAVRDRDRYVVDGQKIPWTSRAEHSDLMLLLARTTPRDRGREEGRWPVGVPDRHACGGGQRHDDPPDPHDDEPRHDRDLLRSPGRSPPPAWSARKGRASATSCPG